jgi:hypothetical protein
MLEVTDGRIFVCPTEASEPQDSSVVVAETRWGLYWPSKDVHDRGVPGQLAVCGYSENVEIPAAVARRLKLIDALRPLAGAPGVWVIPVERIVLGLVREASAKGITDSAQVEAYVTWGLAECGSDVEPDGIRSLIGGCQQENDPAAMGTNQRAAPVAAAAAAEGVASVPHGGSPQPHEIGCHGDSATSVAWPDGPGESGFFWRHGRPYRLGPTPFRMMSLLWSAPGCSLPVEDVLQEVWNIRPAAVTKRDLVILRTTACRIAKAILDTGIQVPVGRDPMTGRARVSLLIPPDRQ